MPLTWVTWCTAFPGLREDSPFSLIEHAAASLRIITMVICQPLSREVGGSRLEYHWWGWAPRAVRTKLRRVCTAWRAAVKVDYQSLEKDTKDELIHLLWCSFFLQAIMWLVYGVSTQVWRRPWVVVKLCQCNEGEGTFSLISTFWNNLMRP